MATMTRARCFSVRPLPVGTESQWIVPAAEGGRGRTLLVEVLGPCEVEPERDVADEARDDGGERQPQAVAVDEAVAEAMHDEEPDAGGGRDGVPDLLRG